MLSDKLKNIPMVMEIKGFIRVIPIRREFNANFDYTIVLIGQWDWQDTENGAIIDITLT